MHGVLLGCRKRCPSGALQFRDPSRSEALKSVMIKTDIGIWAESTCFIVWILHFVFIWTPLQNSGHTFCQRDFLNIYSQQPTLCTSMTTTWPQASFYSLLSSQTFFFPLSAFLVCLVGQEARAGLCWQQTAAKAPFILPGYPLDSTWCQQWPSHVVIWHRSGRSCVHVPCMPIRCLKEPEVVLPGLELKLSWLAVQTLGHKLSTLMMHLKWSDIPSRLIFRKSDEVNFLF